MGLGRGLEGLRGTIESLAEKGLKVYVIGASPLFPFNPSYLKLRKAGNSANGDASWTINRAVFTTELLLGRSVGAQLIDPLRNFCAEEKCVYMRNGTLLFSDYGHFSPFGSKLAVKSILSTVSLGLPVR